MSRNSRRRVGFALALAGAAALTAPALAGADTGSLGSSDPGATTSFVCSALSTGDTPAGWGTLFDDEKGYVSTHVADKVLDADGSLKLAVESVTDRSVAYHPAGSITLADAAKSPISFSEKGATSIGTFQLRLLGTTGGNFDNGFTTLVWDASVQSTVSTVAGGTHVDLEKGKWWSTQNIDGAKDRVPVTLDTIIAANKGATVEHYGVAIGSGLATDSSTLIDAVKFNGCTTNFALKDPAATGSLGSLGSIFGS